jgi:hypothetical protein
VPEARWTARGSEFSEGVFTFSRHEDFVVNRVSDGL